jgi:hypothetical protein
MHARGVRKLPQGGRGGTAEAVRPLIGLAAGTRVPQEFRAGSGPQSSPRRPGGHPFATSKAGRFVTPARAHDGGLPPVSTSGTSPHKADGIKLGVGFVDRKWE